MHRLNVAMSEQSPEQHRGVLSLVQVPGAGTLAQESHLSGESG